MTLLCSGARPQRPRTPLSERSVPAIEAESASEPQGVSNAGEAAVELGNEWFGDPAYQAGVYETVIEPGGTIRWTVLEGIHNVYECGENWTKSDSCAAADWSSAQIISAGRRRPGLASEQPGPGCGGASARGRLALDKRRIRRGRPAVRSQPSAGRPFVLSVRLVSAAQISRLADQTFVASVHRP